MQKQPITILAINPGAKYLGIAVFKGKDLRDWAIKVVSGKWSKKKTIKIRAIVSDLIMQYRPNALAIKKLNPSRSSANLDALVLALCKIAEEKGISVHEYSMQDLERFYSPIERINKRELAEAVACEYPALLAELVREKSHRNKYYGRVFEAVALGAACSQQLDCQS